MPPHFLKVGFKQFRVPLWWQRGRGKSARKHVSIMKYVVFPTLMIRDHPKVPLLKRNKKRNAGVFSETGILLILFDTLNLSCQFFWQTSKPVLSYVSFICSLHHVSVDMCYVGLFCLFNVVYWFCISIFFLCKAACCFKLKSFLSHKNALILVQINDLFWSWASDHQFLNYRHCRDLVSMIVGILRASSYSSSDMWQLQMICACTARLLWMQDKHTAPTRSLPALLSKLTGTLTDP